MGGKTNVFGGKRAKQCARSSTSSSGRNKLRVAEEEGEIYAIVTKMLGNGCAVHCIDGINRLCLISGKFKGKNKSMNMISPGSWVLVGVREWETVKDKSIPRCDLCEVYTHVDKERLKSAGASVDWDILLANDVTNMDKMNGKEKIPESVHFMTGAEEDYLKTMELAMKAPTAKIEMAATTAFSESATVDRVYVDDI